MKFKVRDMSSLNTKRIIGKVVTLVVGLFVGDEIIRAISTTLTGKTVGAFGSALGMLGFNTSGAANTYGVGVSSTGLLTIFGLVMVASLVLEFINVSW